MDEVKIATTEQVENEYLKMPKTQEETATLFQEFNDNMDGILQKKTYWMLVSKEYDNDYKIRFRKSVHSLVESGLSNAKAEATIKAQMADDRTLREKSNAIYMTYSDIYYHQKRRAYAKY